MNIFRKEIFLMILGNFCKLIAKRKPISAVEISERRAIFSERREGKSANGTITSNPDRIEMHSVTLTSSFFYRKSWKDLMEQTLVTRYKIVLF